MTAPAASDSAENAAKMWMFIRSLRESNLLTPARFEEVQAQQGVELSKLTEWMVQQKWLTDYQVKRIRDGGLRTEDSGCIFT